MPLTHGEQARWPTRLFIKPLAQGRQAVLEFDPNSPLKVPTAHGVHAVDCVKSAKEPKGHSEQAAVIVLAPIALPYVPTSQVPVHEPAPSISSNVPSGHGAHGRYRPMDGE